jgi:hypothetical protein
MPQLPSWLVMTILVGCMALTLWLFSHAREDAHSDIHNCNFDDPKERLKELEAAFAAGMMTHEEFQRLSERLGGDQPKPASRAVSSRNLPKTWDDVKPKPSE